MPLYPGTPGDDNLRGGDAADTMTGIGGNDELRGNGGNDTIDGGDDNDLIDGGSGIDSMTGGNGNDVFFVDDAGDQVFELFGEGSDIIYTLVTYTLPNNVERMSAFHLDGLYAINLFGNGLDNELWGNAAANLLDGGIGADIMRGGNGSDSYNVDNSGDVVIEQSGGGGGDAVFTSISYRLPVHVETLSARDLASTDSLALIGNDVDNFMTGNAGSNILDGGAGADNMFGRGGDDIYFIENVNDRVNENAGEGQDLVYTTFNYALPANVERLSVNDTSTTFAINLTGNSLANEIWGNDGRNVIGAGAGDILRGNGGDDDYRLSDIPAAIIEQAGDGLDTVFLVVFFDKFTDKRWFGPTTYTLPDNVERLASSDFNAGVNFTLTGNGLDNEMWGGGLADVIDGRGGADLMKGNGGDDLYFVDNVGDVVLEYAEGAQFGGGNDLIYTTVDYTLPANVERMGVNGFTTTFAINLTGNSAANELWGNDGANLIDGLQGNDILRGNGGADQFRFTTAPGSGNVDVIVGFQPGSDKIALDDAVFTALTPGDLPASAFVGVDVLQDGDDRILYDPSNGGLYYDADANGPGGAIQFASVQPGLNLTSADIIVI